MGRSWLLVTLLALGAVLPAARALPAAKQIAQALHAMDTTGNDAIDAAEWRQASFMLFRAADKNNNDYIDAAEMAAGHLAEDTFRRIDADHDGRLSIDEFMKMRRELFTVADRNHDDYVTLTEFELLIVLEAVGWQDKNGNGRMDSMEMRETLGKLVELIDADHDALLDVTEAAYMQPERFKRFDKNQDGKLSLDELLAGYRSEFEA